MKKSIFSALTFVAVLTVALTAFAQPGGGPGGPGGRGPGGMMGGRGPMGPGGPGGPGGMMGGGMFIFQNEELKKELGLTEEQNAQLGKIAEEQRNAFRQRLPQRGGGERPTMEDFNRMRAEFEKARDETHVKINQVLSPEQQGKFKELRFKLAGGLNSPFLDSFTLDVVNLTDEQKAKLKAIQEKREEEGRKAFESRGPVNFRELSQEERQRMFAEIRNELDERQKKYAGEIKAVLTPEQLQKAETLTQSVQETRDKFGLGNRGGRGQGRGGEGYRPNEDSWRPGQGGQRRDGDRPQRRAFPQQER